MDVTKYQISLISLIQRSMRQGRGGGWGLLWNRQRVGGINDVMSCIWKDVWGHYDADINHHHYHGALRQHEFPCDSPQEES